MLVTKSKANRIWCLPTAADGQWNSPYRYIFWGMKRAITLHRAKRNGGAAVRNSPDSDSADDHAHGPAPDPASWHYSCVFWEFLFCLLKYWVPRKKDMLFSSRSTCLNYLSPTWSQHKGAYEQCHLGPLQWCAYLAAVVTCQAVRCWSLSTW